MLRDDAPVADLKLLTAAAKEFRYADLIFRPYIGIPKVAIFGSARTREGDGNYVRAEEFAHEISSLGWMVITGGGPGIMAAGNAGAGADKSFGLRIRLPFESGSNATIEADRKLINFKYFFTRKVFFMKESHAFVLLPGGFGTLDEAFELLTLMQTGRSDLHPIVLLERPGSTYWGTWLNFLREEVASLGLIEPGDLDLMKVAATPADAVAELQQFYSNYQSERYVRGRLILRIKTLPDQAAIDRLNEEFADLVTEGEIEVSEATDLEVADGDSLELKRLALWFNRKNFSRLRNLIDRINEIT